MIKHFETLAELAACVGQEVAVTDWFTVEQAHIDQFAQATGDHQWIHVDPERAKAGPFGDPIAHGYLTLSMLAGHLGGVVQVREVRMGVNYGLNKVRFMAPVPVGSRLRARVTLLDAQPLEGGMQLAWRSTIEREGADKPVCVAEPLARYYV
ncbi:MAG TPA: MaoC family dehydratase [Ottowia sp.]|uniref:MaoC family dehydratase n=1 Tax=Ottowia sp. TaxID=1898956 RepID=UPI002BBB16E2|nr:MaoC family dehydratase [Ottowia sp.]HNE60929.1 MaoC family dehydratase [Ottowia sp.]HNJ45019.1 MaoC family dehydratase [Ottowia sp.]HNK54100.1 MaoC family dehydratase [Ottowia sp.]HNL42547.1 MaoC family dehydratase [Ottowia sp.]HNN33089.1 MaoC family dehydratase [Ottowia sp.]